MAGAARADGGQLPRVSVVALDRVRAVAVGAAGGSHHVRLAKLSVEALRPLFLDPRVAAATRVGDVRARNAAFRIALRPHVVRTVAGRAHRHRVLHRRALVDGTAVDAVMVLADDVAAGKARLLDHRGVAVTCAARALEIGTRRARCGIARPLDVLGAVAVRARGRDRVALRARAAVNGRRILLEGLVVARPAVDRLLRIVRELVRAHAAMARRAWKIERAVHGAAERFGIYGDGPAAGPLDRRLCVAREACVVGPRSRCWRGDGAPQDDAEEKEKVTHRSRRRVGNRVPPS